MGSHLRFLFILDFNQVMETFSCEKSQAVELYMRLLQIKFIFNLHTYL